MTAPAADNPGGTPAPPGGPRLPRSPVTSGRPRPATSDDTAFFWEGSAKGELLAQACADCGRLRHPPGPVCPACLSFDWVAQRLSGRGRVHSYTVLHHPALPAFDEPPVIAVVELDEGLRMVANVVDAAGRALAIGDEVAVLFSDQDEGWTIPQCTLASEEV